MGGRHYVAGLNDNLIFALGRSVGLEIHIFSFLRSMDKNPPLQVLGL